MTSQRWQQIESLYHHARNLEPSEQQTFLATACMGDEGLRGEVESLLRHDAQKDMPTGGGIRIAAQEVTQSMASSLVGREIGCYEIVSLLGVGGMGEVYRAKDFKLRRYVAIKVLPSSVANDPEQLHRLRREAHILASLNHPNIGAIYGLEQSNDTTALVLELVEGTTLAEQLASGPLTVVEALTFALQITLALEAAHDKGIIHRDLKPGNVKITPDGTAKVLDFGLAKVFAAEAKDGHTELSVTVEHTREGVIAGTPAYMSPEQALGKTLDRRTDIWSFGCLLYEMLTGKSPFLSETVNETMSNILSNAPNWQSIPSGLPERGLELLQRCLQKDVSRRRRDIGDVRIELEHMLAALQVNAPPRTISPTPQKKSKRTFMWAAAALVATVALSAWIWYDRPEPFLQVMRLNMDVRPADALTGLGG